MNRFPLHAATAVLSLFLAVGADLSAQEYYGGYNHTPSYSHEQSLLQTPLWRSSLPNLHSYQIIGPTTGRDGPGAYNCFAHTLGTTGWVWPGTTIGVYDNLYASSGFRRSSSFDASPNPHVEKVVIYGRPSDGHLEVTHGARQQSNGTWTSKLGSGPLIRHWSLESLSGPAYGSPVAVYVRPKYAAPAAAGNFAQTYQQQPQVITQPVSAHPTVTYRPYYR